VGVERERVQSFGSLAEGLRQAGGWYLWGPYLSERQWGTVREDYSADGEAWSHLPHDHARSRAYRWGEDGLAGFSDVEQRLCLALALWNGRDPILKERIFGLTGGEGNHGEDAKEYWWYLDAVPSHAWNRWRYHYPQRAFPYEHLRVENGRRSHQGIPPELPSMAIRLRLKAPLFLVVLNGAMQASGHLRRSRFTDSGGRQGIHLHPDVGPLFELRFAGFALAEMLRKLRLIVGP